MKKRRLKLIWTYKKLHEKVNIKKELYIIRIKNINEHLKESAVYCFLFIIGFILCFVAIQDIREVYTIFGGIGTGMITSTIVTLLINLKAAKKERKEKEELKQKIIIGLGLDAIAVLEALSIEFYFFILSINKQDLQCYENESRKNIEEYMCNLHIFSNLDIINVQDIDMAYYRCLTPFFKVAKEKETFIYKIKGLIYENNKTIPKILTRFNDLNLIQLYGINIINDDDILRLDFKEDVFALQKLYDEKKEYCSSKENDDIEIIDLYMYGNLFYKTCKLCKKIIEEVADMYSKDMDIVADIKKNVYDSITHNVKNAVYNRIDEEAYHGFSIRFYR